MVSGAATKKSPEPTSGSCRDEEGRSGSWKVGDLAPTEVPRMNRSGASSRNRNTSSKSIQCTDPLGTLERTHDDGSNWELGKEIGGAF